MAGINVNTVLALHCNGVDGSTSFIDSSPIGRVVTALSNAQIDTAQSVFGGASGLFDGVDDGLQIGNSSDFAFLTANLTIDFRVRFANTIDERCMMHYKVGSQHFYFYGGTNGFRLYAYGSNRVQTSGMPALSINTWHHVALIRESGTWKIYVDGTLYGSSYSVVSLGTPDNANGIRIGVDLANSADFFGHIDEFRVQNGEAYWTANFTPPTEEYTSGITLNISEQLNLGESWDIKINPESIIISEELNLEESWNIHISAEELFINEQLNLGESWDIKINPESIIISEELDIADNWIFNTVEFFNSASHIIWLNPLIIVTDTDPAKIISIDITIPSAPVKTVYDLVGCKNAKGVVYNAINEYFYVICAEGKVVKVDKDDLTIQTIINTGETDIFQYVDALDAFLQTYAITDNSEGEIVMIDERDVKKINTDLRWLENIQKFISTRLDWINGKLINTDLRWIATQTKKLKTDLRWIKYAYTDISQHAIDYTKWIVKINGTNLTVLNDVDMDSIQIVHDVTAEEEKGSTATFVLHRRHDKLDYTNAGTGSQITNQNIVIIEIDGHIEFTGKIANLSCDSEGETVTVTAIGTRPSDKRHTVNIPLPSVNEQLSLYHCILNNPVIDNPYVDTRFVITSNNNKYWNGSAWVSKKSSSYLFADFNSAQSYLDSIKEYEIFWNASVRNYEESPPYYKGVLVDLGTKIQQNIISLLNIGPYYNKSLAEQVEDGTFKPLQNWTYFWNASFEHITLGRVGGTNTLKSDLSIYFQVPESEINYEGFIPKEDPEDPNITWPEFFKTTKEEQFQNVNIITNQDATTRYLGTSLGSLSADVWKINFLNFYYQKELEDTEIELGYYNVGSAPYNVIPVQNGQKVTVAKWEDRNDGLYNVIEEGYDYREYTKRIAALEYQKLLNINGQVTPLTSCQISLSIDAYYYYNLGLLTRLNITNTTIANTYNANNGFPVAIKTITIKCATQGKNTMIVELNCNNQKSQIEMEEIDAQYPDEKSNEFLFPELSNKMYSKFDPNSWSYPT